MSGMGNESDDEKAADSVWRDQAVEHGIKFARYIFEKRGNNSEARLTEAELAAMLAVSFERGAREATWELHPNETTIAAMIDAREGGMERVSSVADLFADLHSEDAEREAQVQSKISLTARDSMLTLDMLENPRPRSAKFQEAMARYHRVVVTGGMSEEERAALKKSEAPDETAKFEHEWEEWAKQNAEAIRSSNEYVEKHGLPLAKYKMPPKGEGEHGDE